MMAAGLAALVATGAGAQERRLNVAFINMDKAFNEFYKTKLADAQIKAQRQEFVNEEKKMVDALDAMQKEFTGIREEALNSALSEEVRSAKRTLAEEKQLAISDQKDKIRRFEELRGRQLEDQIRRMKRGIVEEIRESVKTYARDKAYEAVLDASGTGVSGVEVALYVDAKVDITEDILKIVNKGAPK